MVLADNLQTPSCLLLSVSVYFAFLCVCCLLFVYVHRLWNDLFRCGRCTSNVEFWLVCLSIIYFYLLK